MWEWQSETIIITFAAKSFAIIVAQQDHQQETKKMQKIIGINEATKQIYELEYESWINELFWRRSHGRQRCKS